MSDFSCPNLSIGGIKFEAVGYISPDQPILLVINRAGPYRLYRCPPSPRISTYVKLNHEIEYYTHLKIHIVNLYDVLFVLILLLLLILILLILVILLSY